MSRQAPRPRKRVASPCVSVCALDEQDVCVGCFRSAREITDWFELDDEARLEVLRTSRERMQAAGVLFD
ncbi:MAG TPA: DUF1289 domain-containing protein [Pseudomonadales bacterium]|nr:DUF1289 domain-containing protein [Pseudomonadales bacterium]